MTIWDPCLEMIPVCERSAARNLRCRNLLQNILSLDVAITPNLEFRSKLERHLLEKSLHDSRQATNLAQNKQKEMTFPFKFILRWEEISSASEKWNQKSKFNVGLQIDSGSCPSLGKHETITTCLKFSYLNKENRLNMRRIIYNELVVLHFPR